jgi:hypothetical protein
MTKLDANFTSNNPHLISYWRLNGTHPTMQRGPLLLDSSRFQLQIPISFSSPRIESINITTNTSFSLQLCLINDLFTCYRTDDPLDLHNHQLSRGADATDKIGASYKMA